MQLSVKRKQKIGVKITFTFTKCFRLFTQHLSSGLRHSSGTKELARQTMLFRQKRKEQKRNDTSKSASGGENSRRCQSFSYLIPETEL